MTATVIVSHVRDSDPAPDAYTPGICAQIERRIRRTCALVWRVPPPRTYTAAQPAPPMSPAAYASRVAALAKARAALKAKQVAAAKKQTA